MSLFDEWNEKIEKAEVFNLNSGYHFRKDAKNMSDHEAISIIKKFRENWQKIEYDPHNGSAEQYIAADLAKACAEISPQTPEVALELLNITKELFDITSAVELIPFKLKIYGKQKHHFADAEFSSAYVNITSQNFIQMKETSPEALSALNNYVEIAAGHAELSDKILDTVIGLKPKISANKCYLKCMNDILKAIAVNEKVSETTKNKASSNIIPDALILTNVEADKIQTKTTPLSIWQKIKNNLKKTY